MGPYSISIRPGWRSFMDGWCDFRTTVLTATEGVLGLVSASSGWAGIMRAGGGRRRGTAGLAIREGWGSEVVEGVIPGIEVGSEVWEPAPVISPVFRREASKALTSGTAEGAGAGAGSRVGGGAGPGTGNRDIRESRGSGLGGTGRGISGTGSSFCLSSTGGVLSGGGLRGPTGPMPGRGLLGSLAGGGLKLTGAAMLTGGGAGGPGSERGEMPFKGSVILSASTGLLLSSFCSGLRLGGGTKSGDILLGGGANSGDLLLGWGAMSGDLLPRGLLLLCLELGLCLGAAASTLGGLWRGEGAFTALGTGRETPGGNSERRR